MGNLALLAPELRGPAPIAVIDLGSRRTEVTVLQNGEPTFVRTLSRGVAGLPESAPALVSELRQTFLGFLAVSDQPIAEVVLIGGGASASGADAYLAHQLGVPVRGLPVLEVELATPELSLALPRFGKAIALAVGLSGKAVDLNLRSGPLAFQRGYGILKEKAPLLTGLAAALTVSFVFASWAELRALGHERELLSQALEAQTQNALGEGTNDPGRVEELLSRAKSKDELDPMPHMDAFDVMVEISNDVPTSVVHDVEELEMQRAHVKLTGVVGTTADAQMISNKVAENRCVQDAKVVKVTQVVGGDRQKYVLEFDAKCPEDGVAKKKPKPEEKPAEDTP
jgi:general secretion pathway protein L